jgi:excisionase family DNA binding protein
MHVIELELSPAALACLRAADIFFVAELLTEPADDLISNGVGPNELYEIVARLNERDLSLPPARNAKWRRQPSDRDMEMFRLRLIEGLTLDEVAERLGVSKELVRRLVREAFGLTGTIPTVKARRWAATVRRRIEPEGP